MSGLCEAKQPLVLRGLPTVVVWLLCGEPSTAVYHYECGCGHTRRGWTCDEHRPAEGVVGCSQCWDAGHECTMTVELVGVE